MEELRLTQEKKVATDLFNKMDELRQTALAYYKKMSDAEKKVATDLFNKMDENGDGIISYDEYNNFLEKNGGNGISNRSIFQALDRDSDGSLDYHEFLTIHYMFLTKRIIFCDVCEAFLCGAYFSCVQCFWGSSGNTFHLCRDCYGDKSSYDHHNDAVFLDNYTILISKWREHLSATLAGDDEQKQQSAPAVTSDQPRSVSLDSAKKSNFTERASTAVRGVNAVHTLVKKGSRMLGLNMSESTSPCQLM